LYDQTRANLNTEANCKQIGFLTEWQMYAQQIEGDSWRGDKMDKTKIDKMSGKLNTNHTN